MDTNQPPKTILSFEECLPIIQVEVAKKKVKWRLTSLRHIDFNDVSNILLNHVYTKWYLYDQTRPLRNWLHGLLSNRMRNIIRDNFGAWKRPCLKHCPYFGGGTVCTLYGTQCNKCDLYAKWESGSKLKLEILMPHSVDSPIESDEGSFVQTQLQDKTCNFLNFDIKIPEFNDLLQEKLKPLEWKTYKYLFIDHLSDVECAKNLGYDITGLKNSKGVKAVAKLKTKIYAVSKVLVLEMEF